MSNEIDPVLIPLLRESIPNQIAEDICNVQPLNEACKAFYELWKSSKSEKWLIENGYRPACEHTRLMWIKDEKQIENSGNNGQE